MIILEKSFISFLFFIPLKLTESNVIKDSPTLQNVTMTIIPVANFLRVSFS